MYASGNIIGHEVLAARGNNNTWSFVDIPIFLRKFFIVMLSWQGPELDLA